MEKLLPDMVFVPAPVLPSRPGELSAHNTSSCFWSMCGVEVQQQMGWKSQMELSHPVVLQGRGGP